MTIGKKLEMLISYRGLNQRKLAELLGRSQALVSNWTKGTNLPRLPELATVADALRVPVDYLVRDDDERMPNEVDAEMEVRRLSGLIGWAGVYERAVMYVQTAPAAGEQPGPPMVTSFESNLRPRPPEPEAKPEQPRRRGSKPA